MVVWCLRKTLRPESADGSGPYPDAALETAQRTGFLPRTGDSRVARPFGRHWPACPRPASSVPPGLCFLSGSRPSDESLGYFQSAPPGQHGGVSHGPLQVAGLAARSQQDIQVPPYLAGRKQEKDEFQRLLGQTTILENMVLTGLRGTEKTVLLDILRPVALSRGWRWASADLSESASVDEESLALRVLTDLALASSDIVIGQVERVDGFGFLRKADTGEAKARLRLPPAGLSHHAGAGRRQAESRPRGCLVTSARAGGSGTRLCL